MYDELLNKTPQSQFYNVKLVGKNGPISASQRSLDRSSEKMVDNKNLKAIHDNNPSMKIPNVASPKNADKPPSKGVFHFKRKQGAVKSNERQQHSPRASSKQLLAKQNLSRLTKPFAKNKPADKSQDKIKLNTTNENTEQTARGALVPNKISS